MSWIPLTTAVVLENNTQFPGIQPGEVTWSRAGVAGLVSRESWLYLSGGSLEDKDWEKLPFSMVANHFLVNFHVCFFFSFSHVFFFQIIFCVLNKKELVMGIGYAAWPSYDSCDLIDSAPWLGLLEHFASLHVRSLSGRIVHLPAEIITFYNNPQMWAQYRALIAVSNNVSSTLCY